MTSTLIVAAVLAYLLGSVPSAVWYGKLLHGIDVREHGSGNAGATNTLRTLGNRAGFTVFFMDFVKGFIATKLPDWLHLCDRVDLLNYQMLFAVLAVAGHIAPVFAQFKGGKGIAVLFADVCAMDVRVALICITVFILLVWTTRYISVGSMVGSCISPFVVGFLYDWKEYGFMGFCTAVGIMVVYTHRKNIRRLVHGNENKFSFVRRNS
jgi:glycerol-3-phosphate acyltransferase PlsY